jgi:hypothetical protein
MNIGYWVGFIPNLFVLGNATGGQVDIVMTTGYIDTVVVAPLGIAGAIGFALGKSWWRPLILISLTGALYSAYAWTYLHWTMGTMPPMGWEMAILWSSFLPHVFLFGLVLRRFSLGR